MSNEEIIIKKQDMEGSKLYEQFKYKNSSQKSIRRVVDDPKAIYQCEITGKIFEGLTAREDYESHMNNIDWANIQPGLEYIKNPKKIYCLFQEYDATTPSNINKLMAEMEEERNKNPIESVDDILNTTQEPESEIREQIICSVCETKSKFLKDDSIRYVFKDINSYDEHLWSCHSIAVKRDGEKITIDNARTGEIIAE